MVVPTDAGNSWKLNATFLDSSYAQVSQVGLSSSQVYKRFWMADAQGRLQEIELQKESLKPGMVLELTIFNTSGRTLHTFKKKIPCDVFGQNHLFDDSVAWSTREDAAPSNCSRPASYPHTEAEIARNAELVARTIRQNPEALIAYDLLSLSKSLRVIGARIGAQTKSKQGLASACYLLGIENQYLLNSLQRDMRCQKQPEILKALNSIHFVLSGVLPEGCMASSEAGVANGVAQAKKDVKDALNSMAPLAEPLTVYPENEGLLDQACWN